SGSAALFLLFMNNGRAAPGQADIDLSRTVGWLPNYCNIMFDLDSHEPNNSHELNNSHEPVNSLAQVKQVKKQLNELQDGGLSYTCLRYMNQDKAVREQMAQLPEFQLEFTYLPKSAVPQSDDAEQSVHTLLQPAKESQGSTEGVMHVKFPPFGKSYYHDNCLNIRWGYCPTQYHQATMDAFINNQITQLKQLIDDCQI
ncbi:MAG: hypothetical protein MJK04_32480, partial [Psychrosphaera sp.]|nr:hypothetical protein [Psychrosphaera sp.]